MQKWSWAILPKSDPSFWFVATATKVVIQLYLILERRVRNMDNKNGSKKTHKTQSLARNLVVLSPKMNPALGEELQWIHEDFSTPHKSFDRINGFSLRDITWAEVQSLSDGM